MSELNNTANAKKRFNPYLLIVFLYFIIAIVITGCLIYVKNSSGKNIIEDLKNTNSKVLKIEKTPLNEKYSFNNVKFTTLTSPIRDDIEYSEWSNSMSYVEISGLKDTKVQDQINYKIRSTVQSLYNEEEADNDFYTDIYIYCEVKANFSNILSLSITKYLDFEEENYNYRNHYMYETLNFRLDTGEQIELKDLFTADASIKRILSQSAYRSLGFSIGADLLFQNETYSYDLNDVDYSIIESMVYNFVNDYTKGKKFKYTISPQRITIIYNGNYIDISLADYYEYINLYRIVPNSLDLYEKGNLEAKDYVFGYPYISSLAYNNKISSNVYLMIAGFYYGFQYEPDIIKYKEMIEECLDSIINQIELNENKESEVSGRAKLYYLNYVHKDESDRLIFDGYKIAFDTEELDDKSFEEFLAKASRNRPTEMSTINFYEFVDLYDIYSIYYSENSIYQDEDFNEMKLVRYDQDTENY